MEERRAPEAEKAEGEKAEGETEAEPAAETDASGEEE